MIRPSDGWDPAFYRRSPLFWPIVRAASALEGCRDWPSLDALTGLFEGEPPVRFEGVTMRTRRTRGAAAHDRYDGRIALARRVPTRACSWHDLTNALVWATFPRAKYALHLRQHRTIAGRLGPDLRLPGARTREQDVLAMLDEGGVVLLSPPEEREAVTRAAAGERSDHLAGLVADARATVVVFGHAIYEHLATGKDRTLRALGRVIDRPAGLAEPVRLLAAVDVALWDLLSGSAVDGAGFVSVVVDRGLADATGLAHAGGS
jgi:hypothetical protein